MDRRPIRRGPRCNPSKTGRDRPLTPTQNPNTRIAVSPRAARALRRGHPWVYRSDLADGNTPLPFAGTVGITDEHGKFLATALASSTSQIALRVISLQELMDTELPTLVSARIAEAADYRKKIVRDTDAYRVVFSEADELPGLIVDKYANVFSLQALTQAMDRDDVRAAATQALRTAYGEEISIFERIDPRIRRLEALPPAEPRLLYGETAASSFQMNGLGFQFDARAGQKTGAFLDQRENYAAAAKYARGRALDVFTYHGGFALHLARVCDQVTGVDVSRAALEQSEKNASANTSQFRCGEIDWIEADAFELLKDYSAQGEQYDTIILDPPAFAKTKKAVEKALSGYKEINLRALKMLRPGGLLVTNSCSHHVSEEEFFSTLTAAAIDARRRVRILEKRTQSQDHPVIATIPETAYLKCLICCVS